MVGLDPRTPVGRAGPKGGPQVAYTESYGSDAEGGACVKVATTPAAVHVRDSKNLPGPQLALTAPAWAAFVAYARVGLAVSTQPVTERGPRHGPRPAGSASTGPSGRGRPVSPP
ncbi:DUF397 domain-containing protein [Streptomyces sp. NPDC018833]|uniref:DUF397 domain-containing protein n=1 Tax=Streptomyces sp. NPDC018833 TaxID=3365053 RepID=UPI00378DB4B5